MSVTYVGNCEWDLSDYAQLAVDAWGFDVISQEYGGRSDKIDTFAALWSHDRTIAHPTYRWATYDKITFAPSPVISKATVTYKGVIGGTLPDPVIKTGMRRQSVTCEYTATTIGTATGVTATFEYYAPFKRVVWFTYGTLASTQQRVGVSKAFDIGPTYQDMLKDLTVLNARGPQGTLKIVQNPQYSRGGIIGFPTFGTLGGIGSFGIVKSTYTVQAQLIESNYAVEQVGSQILMNSSDLEMRLVEANMGYRIST